MGRLYYAYSLRKCAIGDDEMATKNGILLLVLTLETKEKDSGEGGEGVFGCIAQS